MFRVAGGVFGPGVLPEPPPATSELASVSAVTRGKTCYSEGNNLRLQDITAAILAHLCRGDSPRSSFVLQLNALTQAAVVTPTRLLMSCLSNLETSLILLHLITFTPN